MKIYWLLLMTLFCRCNLFKNVNTDIRKSHHSSMQKTDLQLYGNKEWLSRSDNVTFYRDTGNSSYAIQIWPRGIFSFSPEKGFSGTADKVMIEGQVLSGSASSDLSTSKEETSSEVKVAISHEDKQLADSKEKFKQSSPSWKWVIAGLVSIGFLCWYIYWRLHRKFTF